MSEKQSEQNYDVAEQDQISGKKFVIIESTSEYKPREQPESEFEIIPELTSDFHGNDERHRLYIKEDAREQIFKHIGWKNPQPRNSDEQGGILVGHVFQDTEKDVLYGVVEEAIPGVHAKGSPAYLKMDHQTWKAMIQRVDEILDAAPDNKLQVIGWFHTHPNSLSVFMSGTDAATQRRMFAKEWHFAIVLNPHKHVWRTFYGRDSQECQGYMIK